MVLPVTRERLHILNIVQCSGSEHRVSRSDGRNVGRAIDGGDRSRGFDRRHGVGSGDIVRCPPWCRTRRDTAIIQPK